jgi:hypothetical protein
MTCATNTLAPIFTPRGSIDPVQNITLGFESLSHLAKRRAAEVSTDLSTPAKALRDLSITVRQLQENGAYISHAATAQAFKRTMEIFTSELKRLAPAAAQYPEAKGQYFSTQEILDLVDTNFNPSAAGLSQGLPQFASGHIVYAHMNNDWEWVVGVLFSGTNRTYWMDREQYNQCAEGRSEENSGVTDELLQALFTPKKPQA